MGDRATGQNSDMTRADVAKVFGAAVAMRTDPTLVWFDDDSGRIPVPKGGSLLKLVESFPRRSGGTYTAAALARWYAGHDRVIIVTDEQAAVSNDIPPGGRGGVRTYPEHNGGVTGPVPPEVPVYSWNLAGYKYGHSSSGLGTRHTFGGLSDAAWRLIPMLESVGKATWPWMTE
jgi:hypothetical protein